MSRDEETVGQLYDRLPADEWVDLPEYGLRVKRCAEPTIEDRGPCGEEFCGADGAGRPCPACGWDPFGYGTP
jgi:hypothetical protein